MGVLGWVVFGAVPAKIEFGVGIDIETFWVWKNAFRSMLQFYFGWVWETW